LARLGLEKQWVAVIPLNDTERLLRISRSSHLFFAQTNQGALHVFDVETGRFLWTAQLGGHTPFARAVSANSFAVFGTSADVLIALDRRTGRELWRSRLGTIPSCGTICDEDRVLVGTTEGRVIAYSLKSRGPKGDEKIRDKPVEAWAWQTSGTIDTLPLPAQHVTAFGSDDGRVYVVMNDERTTLYRIRTGGPIGDGLGAYGTRTLLIPSADNNLYAIDLLTANVLWVFPSGAPIHQAPLVAGDEIFCLNESGYLSSLDPKTGQVRWNTLTHGAQFSSVSASKLYLRSDLEDLYIVDRNSGRVIADPTATRQRAGLNVREFNLTMLNRHDDRIYIATHSGMVICLREIGAASPHLLRDPKALPFGYIPPEGIKPPTPLPPPSTEPAEPPAADAETKSDAAPAAEDKPEPEAEEPK
jgi:outer membrane protein assembly factor BamB